MFGKAQRGVSERPNKPKKPLIPAWLGTLVIILIVLSFAVALLLWKPWEPVKPKDQITSQQNKEETNKDYRFYDLLPQQQVTPIPEQAVPETKDKSPVVIIEAPANNQPASEATGLSAQQVAPKANYILQNQQFHR